MTAALAVQFQVSCAAVSAGPEVAEAVLLRDIRQLTFGGRRTGEGYFSPDGRKFVFMSEREPGNPFFQIYEMDFVTAEIARLKKLCKEEKAMQRKCKKGQ